MKYLAMYKRWLNDKRLPGDSGLCLAFESVGARFPKHIYETLDTFDFWCESDDGDFNDVRQNMVLLLAAMNNEL